MWHTDPATICWYAAASQEQLLLIVDLFQHASIRVIIIIVIVDGLFERCFLVGDSSSLTGLAAWRSKSSSSFCLLGDTTDDS